MNGGCGDENERREDGGVPVGREAGGLRDEWGVGWGRAGVT